jgi:hypothetical protein
MIATIIIVSLAFIWLGYESNWMTIRLPSGKPLQSKSSGMKTKSNTTGLTKPKLDKCAIKKPIDKISKENPYDKFINPPISSTVNNDTAEHNPVTFIPLDMPDMQGTVNIISKRL